VRGDVVTVRAERRCSTFSGVVERIVDFFRPYMEAPWGYVVVFTATLLENSIGAGVIVPGETLVIIGGVYAGLGDLWVPGVAAVAIIGAVIGDNIGYWIGRRFGRGFLERHGRKVLVTPERIEATERFYARHGGKTVFFGRFIPVVRSVGFIVAGVSHMPWKRFLIYDIAGAIIWGVGHTMIGYALGESYERLERYATPFGVGLLVLLLLVFGGSKFFAARRKVREEFDEIEAELEDDRADTDPALEPERED
jgi:membrane protein DedA with SNARE-associated domain